MKVKLLIPRCGPGVDDRVGDVIEVDPATGQRMVDAGQAMPAGSASARETAVPPAPARPVGPKPQKTVKPKPEKAVK